MKNKKRRYWLVFHSRADVAISAAEKYEKFFEQIKDIPVPWGPGKRPIPPAPKFGRLSSASVALTKFFGDGVKRATMTFVYRRLLEDKGSSDDLLTITFDPAKVDVHYLTHTIIPKYIEAFDAYLMEYFDEQFISSAWESREEEGKITLTAKSKVDVNPRLEVARVNIASFYDDILCRRAFQLSPAEVVDRFQGEIEIARLLQNGVYLVAKSQAVPFDEAKKVSREMTNILLG